MLPRVSRTHPPAYCSIYGLCPGIYFGHPSTLFGDRKFPESMMAQHILPSFRILSCLWFYRWRCGKRGRLRWRRRIHWRLFLLLVKNAVIHRRAEWCSNSQTKSSIRRQRRRMCLWSQQFEGIRSSDPSFVQRYYEISSFLLESLSHLRWSSPLCLLFRLLNSPCFYWGGYSERGRWYGYRWWQRRAVVYTRRVCSVQSSNYAERLWEIQAFERISVRRECALRQVC